MSKGGPFNTTEPIPMPEHRGGGELPPGCWQRAGKIVRILCPACEKRRIELTPPKGTEELGFVCPCGFDRRVYLIDLHVKGGV